MNIPTITLQTGRTLGRDLPTYIIAEIGSNHDGDLERAKALIHAAKDAGADAAKFQSFRAETLLNPKWRKEGKWEKDPVWDIIKKYAIPEKWHTQLFLEAKRAGIDFLSTPFDLERLELLVDIGVPAIKIASGDLTYHELLRAAGKSGKPVFLSTGHATLGEVESALCVLWETGCKEIALLHCASIYPASFTDANLHAMGSMQHGFQLQVGYSDHTPGHTVPVGAVAFGACIIEKHLTDDKGRSGPDHSFALEVDEFAEMVLHIRQLEDAMQGKTKTYRPNEKMERIMARRAIYAKQRIPKGTRIRREMVNIVRHAYPDGIPANQWDTINGLKASKNIEKDELLTWEMI